MKKVLVRVANKLLSPFHIKLIEHQPLRSIAPESTDLNEVIHLNNTGRNFVFRCPMSKFRTLNGFGFTTQQWHPFMAQVNQLLKNKEVEYKESVLYQYYEAWKPVNARQALLTDKELPGWLEQYPSFTFHTPWNDFSPDERRIAMATNIEQENLAIVGEKLPAGEGYGLQGPVSDRKGEMEFSRIEELTRSILKRGYDRMLAGDDVTGVIIKWNDDFVCCVAHGQHRVAVLAALGYTHVPVRILKNYDVKYLEHWPQVYKGVWSSNETLNYMEHLFKFDSLAWAYKLQLSEDCSE